MGLRVEIEVSDDVFRLQSLGLRILGLGFRALGRVSDGVGFSEIPGH